MEWGGGGRGDTTIFGVVLTQVLEVLAMLKEGDAQCFLPLKRGARAVLSRLESWAGVGVGRQKVVDSKFSHFVAPPPPLTGSKQTHKAILAQSRHWSDGERKPPRLCCIGPVASRGHLLRLHGAFLPRPLLALPEGHHGRGPDSDLPCRRPSTSQNVWNILQVSGNHLAECINK